METTTTAPAAEPTMDQLRSMVSGEPETKTPEPEAKPAKEETQTPESGTDTTQHQEEIEEELPPNVAKRIAAESKKAAFFQSKIDQAVSARKAKEAEAAKLTDKPGSEPVKTTESARNERPKRPDLATFDGTLAEYNAAVAKADEAIEKWLEDRTRETVQREFTQQQAKEAQQKEWATATEKHGADFPALMKTLADNTPEPLQAAISELEDWAGVAVHLAKNDDERTSLVEEFKKSPARAIAKLGKLEDRLTPEAKTAPAKEETLPKPLKPVGGDAPGGAKPFDPDKASTPEALAHYRRMLKRAG